MTLFSECDALNMVDAMNRCVSCCSFSFQLLFSILVLLPPLVESLLPIAGPSRLLAQDVDPLKLKYPPTVRKEVGTQWTVTGTVTSETTGLPVPGVVIAPIGNGNYVPMSEGFQRKRVKNETTSGIVGGYSLKIGGSSLVFTKPGFAPKIAWGVSGSVQDVELAPGRVISGRILLPDGDPAVGATVTPVNWLVPYDPPPVSKPAYATPNYSYKHAYAAFSDQGVSRSVKTDGNGRFEIEDMPAEYRVGLAVRGGEFKEEVVFVANDEDAASLDFPEQNLESNGFEFELSRCSTVSLEGKSADGKPVRIKRVSVIGHSSAMNWFQFRRIIEVDGTSVTIPLRSYPKGATFLVEPRDQDELLGHLFTIPKIGELDALEQTCEFTRGVVIEGQVIEEITRQPIPGVNIQWNQTERPNQHHVEGAFPQLDLKTDRAGRFRLAVPDVDGIVGIQGLIEGHMGFGAQLTHQDFHGESSLPIYERYTRTIERNRLEDLGSITFEIPKAIGVTIKVVDPSGQGVADSVVTFSKRLNLRVHRWGDSTSMGMESRMTTLTSGRDGVVKLENFYDDALLLEQAIQINTGNGKKRFGLQAAYPTPIAGFSADGLKQGQAVVPLPNPDRQKVEVDLPLIDGGNVIGRCVDQAGGPIGELEITVGGSLGQQWSTRTRKDGWFKVQGVPSGGQIRFSFDRKRVKQLPDRNGLSELVNLKPGETLLVGQIMMIDFSKLAGPLPTIDINGLSFQEAAKRVMLHVENCLSEIPTEPKPTGSYSLGGPAWEYRRRLIAQVNPVIVDLMDQKPGTNEAFEILQFACDRLLDLPNLGSGLRKEGADLGAEFRTRILRNHNERESAQALLIRLTESFRGTDDPERWNEVYSQARVPQTKLVTALKRLAYRSNELTTLCRQRTAAKTFEEKMKAYRADTGFIKRALPDFEREKSPYVITQFIGYIKGVKLRLGPSNQIRDGQELDAERVKEVTEMLDSVLEMVDRVKGD